MEGGPRPSSWPALLQDGWQWPSTHHSPKEPGGPGPGVQGYSVLSSLVGPACIFLRPSIAAIQTVCTAVQPLPLPLALPLLEGAQTEWGGWGKGTQIPEGRGQKGTATQGVGREVAASPGEG